MSLFQWDKLLSYSFHNHGNLKYFGILGMGFNCLCLIARSTIQLTYAVSILYFVNAKIEKRTETYALASFCILFAVVPSIRNYRVLSIFSFIIATAAALCITAASLLHGPVQGVQHTKTAISIRSLAWVYSIIVYTFGDTSAAVDTLVTIEERNRKHQFKYAFGASTGYTLLLSLLAALSSYWAFGDELAKISPAAQPCSLAVLPHSVLRDIASILVLILELIAIGHSLYPIFMCLERIKCLRPYRKHCYIWRFTARASIVGLICFLAVGIPFSGSLEIAALVGSAIVSFAVYIIPTAAHMLYLAYPRHRKDVELESDSLIISYMINLVVFAGVLVLVVVVGGLLTGIRKVFLAHRFHRSDFWNKCYLCADLQLSSDLPPIGAPAPTQFVHSLTSNITMSNPTHS